jgi:DNA-binding transcriptional MocR family regulator
VGLRRAAEPQEVTIVGAEVGLHIVVWLNTVPSAREDELIASAHAAGVGIHSVKPLYAAVTGASEMPSNVGLVMGYASLDNEAIRRGVRSLRQVMTRSVGTDQPQNYGEVHRRPNADAGVLVWT